MRDHPFGSARPGLACPGCGATPRVGQRWVCGPDGCGASFDTFATRGACRACGARFPWTQCPACDRRFSHAAWYRGG